MEWSRFWIAYFSMMTICFLVNIALYRLKGVRVNNIFTGIIVSVQPYLFYLMWRNESVGTFWKLINSSLALLCIVSGLVSIYVKLRKR